MNGIAQQHAQQYAGQSDEHEDAHQQDQNAGPELTPAALAVYLGRQADFDLSDGPAFVTNDPFSHDQVVFAGLVHVEQDGAGILFDAEPGYEFVVDVGTGDLSDPFLIHVPDGQFETVNQVGGVLVGLLVELIPGGLDGNQVVDGGGHSRSEQHEQDQCDGQVPRYGTSGKFHSRWFRLVM